jgi:hypothetical protein
VRISIVYIEREDKRSMASYEEVVSKDLELLWSIQEYCYRTPWINQGMSKIISKNPFKDIVIILWIFYIVGLVEIGHKHFWVVAINMIVSFSKFISTFTTLRMSRLNNKFSFYATF